MTDLSKPLDGLGLAQVNGIINDRLAKKQNVLTPGDGISIVEQDGTLTISAAGAILSNEITNAKVITEEAYNALTSRPSTTLYIIPED